MMSSESCSKPAGHTMKVIHGRRLAFTTVIKRAARVQWQGCRWSERAIQLHHLLQRHTRHSQMQIPKTKGLEFAISSTTASERNKTGSILWKLWAADLSAPGQQCCLMFPQPYHEVDTAYQSISSIAPDLLLLEMDLDCGVPSSIMPWNLQRHLKSQCCFALPARCTRGTRLTA